VWLIFVSSLLILASNLRSTSCVFYSQLEGCCVTTLGSYVPVTKLYNLVPVNGQWRSVAVKIIAGHASRWPCTTDLSGSIYLWAQDQRKEDEYPPMFLQNEAWHLCILNHSCNFSLVSSIIHRVTVKQFLHTISMPDVFMPWCEASCDKRLLMWHQLLSKITITWTFS